MGTHMSFSSGFYPQTNGQMEHVNQDLETVLQSLATGEPESWRDHLLWAEYAHNID